MARDRFGAGLWLVTIPTGGSASSLIIDNQNVNLQGSEKATLYVRNFCSFDTGKMKMQYLGENKEGISGAIQG